MMNWYIFNWYIFIGVSTVQAPPFLDNLPLYVGFSWTPPSSPLKSRTFEKTPITLTFFILNTILSFKNN